MADGSGPRYRLPQTPEAPNTGLASMQHEKNGWFRQPHDFNDRKEKTLTGLYFSRSSPLYRAKSLSTYLQNQKPKELNGFLLTVAFFEQCVDPFHERLSLITTGRRTFRPVTFDLHSSNRKKTFGFQKLSVAFRIDTVSPALPSGIRWRGDFLGCSLKSKSSRSGILDREIRGRHSKLWRTYGLRWVYRDWCPFWATTMFS